MQIFRAGLYFILTRQKILTFLQFIVIISIKFSICSAMITPGTFLWENLVALLLIMYIHL